MRGIRPLHPEGRVAILGREEKKAYRVDRVQIVALLEYLLYSKVLFTLML